MGGGVHRTASRGEYSKSPEARAHDFIFSKLTELLLWVKCRHPHVIVVIENPIGALRSMPFMKELEDELALLRTKVDYCAFGRDEKKPTMLWTNDHNLRSRLQVYNCSERCPYGKAGESHPVDLRSTAHEFDYSSIPEALAEEVAEYANSKFCLDNLRRTKAVPPEDKIKHDGDSSQRLTSRDARNKNIGSGDEEDGDDDVHDSDNDDRPAREEGQITLV